MKRQKLKIDAVAQNGDARQFWYSDGTKSEWVPAPGHDMPGDKFHRPLHRTGAGE